MGRTGHRESDHRSRLMPDGAYQQLESLSLARGSPHLWTQAQAQVPLPPLAIHITVADLLTTLHEHIRPCTTLRDPDKAISLRIIGDQQVRHLRRVSCYFQLVELLERFRRLFRS